VSQSGASVAGAELARIVVAAVADGDAARARPFLHPYLRWIEGGATIYGRTTVLGQLADRSELAEPAGVELRDGQIYRWFADD
jgi:hypothetical protein